MNPTSSVRVLRALVAALERYDVDRRAFLASIDVPPAVIDDDDARIPFENLVRAWELAPAWCNDDDFGLHFAEQTSFGDFDVLDYAARSSANVGEAFRRLARYQQLLHDAVMVDVLTCDHEIRVVHRVVEFPAGVPRHGAEAALASWVVRARALTHAPIAPTSVQFRHAAPNRTAEHRRIFRAPVHFDAEATALVLAPHQLTLPIITADSRLGALLDRHAELVLERLPKRGLIAGVRAVLTDAMKSGEARVGPVAKRLGTSKRTLQRRLAEDGLRFEHVLDDLRKELAFRYLSDASPSERNLCIGEVAFLLGYSDTTAFHRAFRRWAGCTPQAFRRRGAATTDPTRARNDRFARASP